MRFHVDLNSVEYLPWLRVDVQFKLSIKNELYFRFSSFSFVFLCRCGFFGLFLFFFFVHLIFPSYCLIIILRIVIHVETKQTKKLQLIWRTLYIYVFPFKFVLCARVTNIYFLASVVIDVVCHNSFPHCKLFLVDLGEKKRNRINFRLCIARRFLSKRHTSYSR